MQPRRVVAAYSARQEITPETMINWTDRLFGIYVYGSMVLIKHLQILR